MDRRDVSVGAVNGAATIQLLLVEDNPGDLSVLQRAFTEISSVKIGMTRAASLEEALGTLQTRPFDLVLLDLGLPDSQGVDTFAHVHAQAPTTPILVLTAPEEDEVGEVAVQNGALDYFSKSDVQAPWLGRAIRYAVDRARMQRELQEIQQRQRRDRELDGVERLSLGRGTAITSRIYSAGSLRETATEEFGWAVETYMHALDLALESRIHKATTDCSEVLREVSERLGFLRVSPRDVIDVHVSALRKRIADQETVRANAYIEEGRLTALELMGNLVSYYRTYYYTSSRREVSLDTRR